MYAVRIVGIWLYFVESHITLLVLVLILWIIEIVIWQFFCQVSGSGQDLWLQGYLIVYNIFEKS